MPPIISVKNLNKKFCGDLKVSLLYGIKDIAREVLNLERRSNVLRKKEFWALNNISFDIERGQSIGLIGANGAGKSTLLRIISGLIKPDAGTVSVSGRVAPLIALGAGFNPILTGRENIFVNMAILGLSKGEIKARFDEVVEFSGLDHALDMPVQTYSSGMAARLGFSCAIFSNPEILLIDEVLAVGDLKFRAKCYRKLAELKKSDTTFIMVSHSPQAILSICDVGMFLKKGVLMGVGSTNDVMSQYEADLANIDNTYSEKNSVFSLSESGFRISDLFFRGSLGEILESPVTGQPVTLVVQYDSKHAFDNVNVQVAVSDSALYGERTIFLNNAIDNAVIAVSEGTGELLVHFPYLGLNPGMYSLKISVYQDELHILNSVEAFSFIVKSNIPTQHTLFYQPRTWSVNIK
jgi:lipopolysaccharide transport system ATP-binding protein